MTGLPDHEPSLNGEAVQIATRISPPMSVVVATRDRPERLERCLESICAALRVND